MIFFREQLLCVNSVMKIFIYDGTQCVTFIRVHYYY